MTRSSSSSALTDALLPHGPLPSCAQPAPPQCRFCRLRPFAARLRKPRDSGNCVIRETMRFGKPRDSGNHLLRKLIAFRKLQETLPVRKIVDCGFHSLSSALASFQNQRFQDPCFPESLCFSFPNHVLPNLRDPVSRVRGFPNPRFPVSRFPILLLNLLTRSMRNHHGNRHRRSESFNVTMFSIVIVDTRDSTLASGYAFLPSLHTFFMP